MFEDGIIQFLAHGSACSAPSRTTYQTAGYGTWTGRD